MWQPDLRAMLPETTAAHRQRLETRLSSPLPDRSGSRAVAHPGEGLGEDAMADPQFPALILLLGLPPEVVGSDAVSSGVETGWPNIREHAPPGLLPFVDDTGGNLWAFDAHPARGSRHRLHRPRARGRRRDLSGRAEL